MGYQHSYSNLCSSDSPPSGDTSPQYVLYCSNQCLARLLIKVLLYFLWVQHHEYAAAVMVLSWMCSLTYGLTLTCLDYLVNLYGAMIRHCANAYGTKDTHCTTKGTQTTDVTSSPVGQHIWCSQEKVTARDLSGVDDSRVRD